MRKVILPCILVLVLAAAAISGCAVTGSGNIVTEKRDFADFTRVDVEGTFQVEVSRSDSFSISISADEDLFDYIAVSKQGETLRIYLSPRHTFTDFTMQAKTLKAKIAMPNLRGLQLSGASAATVTGFTSSNDFDVVVSGASSLDIDDIEVGDAEFDVSGASKVSGNMKADDADFEVSGASTVKLEGSANNITVRASGASSVDLDEFPLNDANINLSGASKATINVKGRLDCVLSAASSLYFRGNPTMGNVNVSGASTIKHE